MKVLQLICSSGIGFYLLFIIIVKFNHIFNVVDSVCSSLREGVGVVVYRYYVDDCFCCFELPKKDCYCPPEGWYYDVRYVNPEKIKGIEVENFAEWELVEKISDTYL